MTNPKKLQTKQVEIIKRNRKYFAAKIGNYDCKIVIDGNTESLEIGAHELLLEDISVRTKYGTDLIFKLAASISEQKSIGFCTLKPESPVRNLELIRRVHDLGGKWDAGAGAWVFSKIVEDAAEELDATYNSSLVLCEVEFREDFWNSKAPFNFLGYELAEAKGRDSGAKIKDGVAVICGGFSSGGSMKNWTTFVRAGTKIRLLIASALLSRKLHDAIKIRRIEL